MIPKFDATNRNTIPPARRPGTCGKKRNTVRSDWLLQPVASLTFSDVLVGRKTLAVRCVALRDGMMETTHDWLTD